MLNEPKRCGVVVCPIWVDLGIDGEFRIIIHYARQGSDVQMTAAFSRYNGELTDITAKFRTLKLVPDWRSRIGKNRRKI